MTGWGQDGRYAHTAGHDITYLAISGALHMIGEEGGKPVPPVNLLGDFGAGGVYLAFGVVSALLHARAGGVGQVVDAAIVDGAASVTGMLHGFLETGRLERRARGQPARRRRALLRLLPLRRRRVGRGRGARAAVLRGAAGEAGDGRATRRSRTTSTRRPGPRSASASPPSSPSARATSGTSSSPTPTAASPRCSRCARRARTATTATAASSSRSAACPSRPRRPASASPSRTCRSPWAAEP